MSGSEVTVVVAPRERFSFALPSLESLLSTVSPERIVYVDGGSPPRVRDKVRALGERHGFRVLRTERFLSPNQARNLGLAHVDTRWVAFVDNDVLFAPGWLERLLERARASGAGVVGPLYLQGAPAEGIVHMAGGDLLLDDEGGRRRYRTVHRLQGRSLAEVGAAVRAAPCDFVEMHCMLVRRELLERTGGLDEGLSSTREHLDVCLAARAQGEEVWLEPSALVAYVPGPPFRLSDLPFFLLRWSEARSRASLERFHAKWGFRMLDAETNLEALKKRRYSFLGKGYRRSVERASRALGTRGARGALRRSLERWEGRLNRALVAVLEVHFAEPPRSPPHRGAATR